MYICRYPLPFFVSVLVSVLGNLQRASRKLPKVAKHADYLVHDYIYLVVCG